MNSATLGVKYVLESSEVLSWRMCPSRADCPVWHVCRPSADARPGRMALGLRGADSRFPFPVDLLGLLKWRSHTSLLQQNLRQLMKVDGGEVVKVTRTPGTPGTVSFGCVSHVCSQAQALPADVLGFCL